MNIRAKSQKYLDLWRKSAKRSMNRQIFAAAMIVGLLTGLVKFAAVGKELVVAWRFGTGDELDAFLIALVVPSLVINVVADSFKSALIPVYIKLREQQGNKAAQQLFSEVIIWALGLLVVTAITTAIAAPLYLPLLASGFTTAKLQLTTRLLWLLSPLILLAGVINIWGGVLNAGERFALAAFSPAIIPLVTVILLLSLPNLGIYALTGGLICGSILEIIILGIGLHRQKINVLPQWVRHKAIANQVASQYVPVATGAFLMCSTNIVDQSMAAMLDSGSVAALGYANRVIALPLTLATLALGTAVVPYFSKTIAQKNWSKIRHTFNYYLKLIFITTVPLTIFIVLASKLIIQVLFERGSFDAEDTQIVSQIQIFYALQIPFYISAIFVVRLINSLGVNHFLAWGSSINLLVNIGANYAFVQWMGVKGIALSTSCVYLISFVFLYILTKKHLQKISPENT
ncbi:MAG: murein biosynthesis integral membrane protein MurJ [Pleurocapsa sp.]